MSYQPTSVPVGSRREQERARRRRKKEWMTKTPLDIRAFYRDTLGVQGEDVIELFAKHTSFIYRNKGEVFIHSGEPVTTVRYLISGVARGYVLDDEGKDNVICFGCRYGQPLLGTARLTGRTSLYYEAVTDMEILEIPASVILQGIQMSQQNWAVYLRLLTENYDDQVKIQIALNTMSGESRYRWFLEDYADIVGIVPQNYVASFLGIQPQSLSRIKRQMKAKENNE